MGRHAGDAQLFPLGSTWYGGDTALIPAAADYGNADIEGASRTFRREEFPNLSASIPGGGDLVAKCVRNVHSTVLEKSTIVKYDVAAGDNGYDRRVIIAGAAAIPCGVVDPWIHQDVQVGDLFWIIQQGIVPVKFDNNAITTPIGQSVTCGAAGEAIDGDAVSIIVGATIGSVLGRIAQVGTVAADGYGMVNLAIQFG